MVDTDYNDMPSYYTSYQSNSSFKETSTNIKHCVRKGDKTYIFDEDDNKPMEKCINDWKMVMKNNLLPIKCTIMENQKKLQVSESCQESIEKVDINYLIMEAQDAVHEQYTNMLTKAVKEIQNKKMAEIKLFHNNYCNICSVMDKPIEEYCSDIDEQATKEEIKSLNTWKSKSTKRRRLVDCKDDQLSCSGSISQDKIKTSSSPVRTPDKYKFTNIVEEKKSNGTYSKWRSNLITRPCRCHKPNCDCNRNPAIKAMTETQAIEEQSAEEGDKQGEKKSLSLIALKLESLDAVSVAFSFGLISHNTDTTGTLEKTRDFQHENINIDNLSDLITPERNVTQETILPTREFYHEELKIPVETEEQTKSDIEIRSILRSENDVATDTIQRTVSLILPSGEVEIIKRESVEDTQWVKPSIPQTGIQHARSSLEVITKQHSKGGSSGLMKKKIYSKDVVDAQDQTEIKIPHIYKLPEEIKETDLKLLHTKSYDPYDVSTVFLVDE